MLPKKTFTTTAQKKLLQYAYPGNIRELKSVIELAAVLGDGEQIDEEHINLQNTAGLSSLMLKEQTLKEYEQQIIQFYLNKYNYDVLQVAEKLGIGKSTIYRMAQNGEIVIK